MLARQVLGYGLKFGALDILVNCAGDEHQGRQRARLFRARLDFSFDLNVKSMHLTIKAFLPAMLQKRGGSSTFSQ
jgi:2-keto-3-deoxy-L-fuconate dehydrogenase